MASDRQALTASRQFVEPLVDHLADLVGRPKRRDEYLARREYLIERLMKLPHDQVRAAVNRLAEHCEFFPKPKEVKEALGKLVEGDGEGVDWEELHRRKHAERLWGLLEAWTYVRFRRACGEAFEAAGRIYIATMWRVWPLELEEGEHGFPEPRRRPNWWVREAETIANRLAEEIADYVALTGSVEGFRFEPPKIERPTLPPPEERERMLEEMRQALAAMRQRMAWLKQTDEEEEDFL